MDPIGSAEDLRIDSSDDALDCLNVFERLEIGPIKLEPRRLIAPYYVYQNGQSEKIDLIYRYSENVFDPSEPASLNLASMIAVQVAMNYGLFATSIVFNGHFDEADRRFIEEMFENTAREIYVNKFLKPNEFLVGPAANLKPMKLNKYNRARLEFPDSIEKPAGGQWKLWQTSPEEHAILSSGGKDSLLTYGLINELGLGAHPIFVNESGRHWFTALNAYRYFKDNIRNTSRVWVNSDRVFSWMLRRMPFIRKNFADIRSDEYPIRLWTVGVFLFGVIALAQKRGAGRILIGDEFDTSSRLTFKGIPHYNGLYDQSRYFDNALSRYYMRKGWSVSQFSLLRPLSELLIEKILTERYPELLAVQMSCHAAHEKGKRIFPCGRCEKCRRIVAMLKAIGADPEVCGYTREQIDSCLKQAALKGIHQEPRDAGHLYFMLVQKNLIDSSLISSSARKEHPEVLKLRFDPERSPVDWIPRDLRRPLFRLFLEHASGSVRRIKRSWVEFDPLQATSLNKPYPFEHMTNRHGTGKTTQIRTRNDIYLWGELTWPEAEEILREVDIALLPVGAIEQHGRHLPLDTDSFDADYLARRVAEACSDPKPLLLPLIPYGVSYHHTEFKGTISISNDVLSQLVYEIGISAAHNGINKLVIINGHGGNSATLSHAAQMINRDAHMFVCVDTGETSDVDIYDITETPNDVHAGEIETSTSLAVRPHLVKMDQAEKFVPQFSSRYLNFTSKRGVSWHAYTKKISPSGVLGDPTKASLEKGQKIWQIMISHLVSLVEDLKSMTLDEIHERRF